MSSATTVAAGRGLAPASTSRASASSAAWSTSPRALSGAGAITSTTSPFGGFVGVALGQLGRASRAPPPRAALVSSRQTATWRSGSISASTFSVAGTRPGDSNATSVPPGSDSTRRSSPRLRGRKPAKRQRSDGSAEATSAASAADGPGSTSTGSPAATHERTST